MASTDNLVKVSQLQIAMSRVNTELGLTVRSHAVSGNTVSFYGSKDGSGNALFSFDFLEELALQQLGTEIVENFAFSAATYPGATNPTVQYSFVDMVKVIKAISTVTDNLLELKSDGFFVGSDDTKADKVTGATAGNISTLDANGNLVDSGVTFAADADITTMLNNVFGS